MQEEIIHALRDSKGYLSGEQLSRQLEISRAAVWKHIQELRRLGYEIEAVTHVGYRLISAPDKLLPREITLGLGTEVLGQEIIYRESMGSTMDEAFALGLAGAPAGTLVCCETQTKGRGRLGRAWASPSGKGIYASLILRPKTPLGELSPLTLVCAVALCEALAAVTGLKPQIKWPNDILINSKKAAGILTELNAEMDRVKFVVVGFGINVNAAASQVPPEATSLKTELKRDVSRVAVLREVLQSLERWLGVFERQGFASVRTRCKELSWTLGKRVKFSEPQGDVVGQAVDLTADGFLLLKKDSGEVVRRISGDAVLVSR